MTKAIVVLSGGQDSTTCLFWAVGQFFESIHCVTFDYNQRHRIEIDAARKVVELAASVSECSITHEVIELGPILQGTSPLVSGSKLEQYTDHKSLPGGLEKTFVPMRNQLFLTIAMNRAAVHEATRIIAGVCEEDYGGYPDCRRIFIDSIEQASNMGLAEAPVAKRIRIITPLMSLTKKATVELAVSLPGCYAALAWTHTAYDGQYPPIGKDHATLLRAKGFEEAGCPDPLVIRAFLDGQMPLPITMNYSVEAMKASRLVFGGHPINEVYKEA